MTGQHRPVCDCPEPCAYCAAREMGHIPRPSQSPRLHSLLGPHPRRPMQSGFPFPATAPVALKKAGRNILQPVLVDLESEGAELLLRTPDVVGAVNVAIMATHHLAFLLDSAVSQFLDPEPVVMVWVVARFLVHYCNGSELACRTVVFLDDDGAVGHGTADGIEGGRIQARGQLCAAGVFALVHLGSTRPQLPIITVLEAISKFD